jgi:hypothetical protein
MKYNITFIHLYIIYIFRKAKNEHHAQLVEVNSYKSNAQIESTKNINLHHYSNELKLKQSDLQNSYYTLLDKFNSSKDEYPKHIQITNIEYLNLDQVLLVRISKLLSIVFKLMVFI